MEEKEVERNIIENIGKAGPGPILGGIEDIVTHPREASHSTVSAEVRREMGINDGLVRFSTGIEDSEDLIEDLGNALYSI